MARTEQAWREPTLRESAILDKLLAADFFGCIEARAQAEGCRVRANCGCGCPSIEIKVDARRPLLPGAESDAPGFLSKLNVEGERLR